MARIVQQAPIQGMYGPGFGTKFGDKGYTQVVEVPKNRAGDFKTLAKEQDFDPVKIDIDELGNIGDRTAFRLNVFTNADGGAANPTLKRALQTLDTFE